PRRHVRRISGDSGRIGDFKLFHAEMSDGLSACQLVPPELGDRRSSRETTRHPDDRESVTEILRFVIAHEGCPTLSLRCFAIASRCLRILSEISELATCDPCPSR